MVSFDLDYDHDKAMGIPLGEVTDEQLLAEVRCQQQDALLLYFVQDMTELFHTGCTKATRFA